MNHISHGVYEEFEVGKWENIKPEHKLEILAVLLGEIKEIVVDMAEEICKDIKKLDELNDELEESNMELSDEVEMLKDEIKKLSEEHPDFETI